MTPSRFPAACARTILVMACLWAGACAAADQIKTRDGRVIEGKILEENDQSVKIQLLGGSAVTFPRKDVVAIQRGKSPAELLEERLEALDPSVPADYETVGMICIEIKAMAEVGRRCLAIAGALMPERFADLEVRIGDSLTLPKDRPLALHHFARAHLAAPGHALARARLDAWPPDPHAAAEDELMPPSGKGSAANESLDEQARGRLRWAGERLVSEEVRAGKLVYLRGAWLTCAEKRKQLGVPEAPLPPGWADLAKGARDFPEGTAGSAAPWAALTEAARSGSLDRTTMRRTVFRRDAEDGAGPRWSTRAERPGLRLRLDHGAGYRCWLVLGRELELALPPGIEGAGLPATAELTVFYRVVDARGGKEPASASRPEVPLVWWVLAEPAGFTLRERPDGPVIAAWK